MVFSARPYKMKSFALTTLLLLSIALKIYATPESTLPVPEARELRSKCLKQCPMTCPRDTIKLMEGNCKPSCRKGCSLNYNR